MRGNSHVRFLGGGERSNASLLPDQTLERKQRFIDQLLSGEVTERSIEDVGGAAALTAAEAKALASGNPEIMEVVRLDTEIRRLTALEAHHANSLRSLGWEIRDVERGIDRTQARRAAVLEDAGAARAAWTAAGEKSPGVVIGRAHFHGDGYRKEAGAALEAALRPLRRATLERRGERVEGVIGSYLGFRLTATVAARLDEGFITDLRLVGRERYDVAYNATQPEGTIASLEAQAHPKHLEQLAASLDADLVRLNHRLEGLRQEAARPFEEGPKLAQLRQERDSIVDRLQLRDRQQEAAVLADDPTTLAPEPTLEPTAPGPMPDAGIGVYIRDTP